MRQLFASLFLLLSAYTFCQPLIEITNFGDNPGNLNAYYHLSSGAENDTLPLLIALHGCSQTAKQLDHISGLSAQSDRHRFHVLFPEQKRINNLNNCFNWFLEEDKNPNDGEAQSIYQMIDYAKNNLPVNSRQIFICGFSAGAEMTVVMMVAFPELFQSGAVLAGGAYYGKLGAMEALGHMKNPPDYSAEELHQKITDANDVDSVFPRLIVLHGEKDKVVHPENSALLLKQWQTLQGNETLIPNDTILFPGRYEAKRQSWSDHNGLEKIIYYAIADIGHTLAVDPGSGVKQGGQAGLFSKDIDFYCLYYILRDFGLIH